MKNPYNFNRKKRVIPAMANNEIKDLDYAVGNNDKVEVIVKFSGDVLEI